MVKVFNISDSTKQPTITHSLFRSRQPAVFTKIIFDNSSELLFFDSSSQTIHVFGLGLALAEHVSTGGIGSTIMGFLSGSSDLRSVFRLKRLEPLAMFAFREGLLFIAADGRHLIIDNAVNWLIKQAEKREFEFAITPNQ